MLGPVRNVAVIVLAEPKAVRDGGLRPIWDRGGTPRAHVTTGGSHGSHGSRLGATGATGAIPRLD
jgi:hypothetical protein